MSRLKFSSVFGSKWTALDEQGRQRLRAQLERFEASPESAGFNLEQLGGRSGLYSIRIGSGDRILLRRSSDPDADWVLEDFGPHDIYRTLRR